MTKQTATAVMFEDVFGDCYVHLAQPQEPDGERDFFVPPHMTLGAMPGDIVEVSIRSFSSVPESFRFVSSLARSGRCYQCYATVRRILDYADVLCSGRFESGEDGRFVADDERIAPVPVFKTKRQSVTDGAKVLASITRRRYSKIHKASVVNSYGDSRLFEPNYRAQLDEVCGNMGFDSDVTVPVPAVSDERQDLRALDTFVFGASSGGIACSVEKKDDGWVLYIHYADVDSFVPRGSEADALLAKRVHSLDTPRSMLHFLPEQLARAVAFSEKEDRAAVTLVLDIDPAGAVRSLHAERSVISADAAFDSECFDKLLSGDRDATEKLHSEKPRTFESLRTASELCRVLKRQVADAFFGTSLVPSFEFQGGSPSAVTEARRSVSRSLFRCCHVMIGAAVATHLSGFPLIYRYAPLPSDEQLLPFLRSGIGESVQPLPLRLMELYYTSDTGVHAKTRYVLAYRAAVAEDISTVPVYNSLYELPAFAPVESPCEDYAGLCMIRILKAWMDGDCELAHTIAAEAVMAYRRGNARRRRAEARLFDITMAEYVSNLPYPAEGIISGLTDGELVITLVNGGVGYLRLEEFGLTDIDLPACPVVWHDAKLDFGSYITVRLDSVCFDKGKAYFVPHR